MTIYEIAFWVLIGIAAVGVIVLVAMDTIDWFLCENDDDFDVELDFIPKSLKRHL